MWRRCLGIGLLLALFGGLPLEGANPKKPANLPPVDADQLPAGQFAGTLIGLPNAERQFRLQITYPEIQLNPKAVIPAAGAAAPPGGNAKAPKGANAKAPHVPKLPAHLAHVQNIHHQLHAIQKLHQAHAAGHAAPVQPIHHMMQMRQALVQIQKSQQQMALHEARLMQQVQQQQARAQQKLLQQELRAWQKQMKAIQKMFKVVQVTRSFDFQAEESVKVRLQEPPRVHDDKGGVKKYTKEELQKLKGKDRNLPGYEGSIDALQVGQSVQVTLGVHHKPKAPAPSEKDKDRDVPEDVPSEHKMQVRMIVILKDSATAVLPKK